MKNRLLKILSVCFALLMLLTACSKVKTMKMKNGAYEINGVSYQNAPLYYRANEYVNEPFAKIAPKDRDEFFLYPVSGMDGEKWLCDEDFMVYCAEGEKLPALWEMKIHAVLINKTVNASFNVQKIVDSKQIASLIGTYQNGTAFPYEDITHADVSLVPNPNRYDIVFEDDHLSYYLIYLQYEEEVLVYEPITDPRNFSIVYPGVEVTTDSYKGEYYAVYHFGKHIMYDRETGLCYSIDSVLSQYFEDEE